MSWKSIVVGVDATPAGGHAAQLGLQIAAAAEVECRLVHATRDVWTAITVEGNPAHAAAFRAAALHAVRERLNVALEGVVPWKALHNADVREGWAPAVLDDVVREAGADLVILGAKHHTALGRWLGGSTVHNLARMLRAPLMVTGEPPAKIRRVLVALDASAAARPTYEAARRLADLFDAELKALHVIEPLPILPETPPPMNSIDYEQLMEEDCAQKVWPIVGAEAERTIRHAVADFGIAAEAKAWAADVVVVGSHGKGFVERMLVGSVTERLLSDLPAPILLVIPAGKKAAHLARSTSPGRQAVAV
ncbi:MAG TPA: universal stress protein [Gemmatimonadales bacterium]|jgi:nucleotide-binding universal stress UspA family protein|nr:universal stress protein [Gemmatimonadales bacterium]